MFRLSTSLAASLLLFTTACSSVSSKSDESSDRSRVPAQASTEQPGCDEVLAVFTNLDIEQLCQLPLVRINPNEFKTCILANSFRYDPTKTDAGVLASSAAELAGFIKTCTGDDYRED